MTVKHLILLFIGFTPMVVSAQLSGSQTIDKDSNAIWVNGTDTTYLQTLTATRKPSFIGANHVIINTDKSYKYNPHFRGSITQYIEDQMQYPEEAIKRGLEGKVVVTFDVDEHGNISNINAKPWFNSDTDSLLVKEAKRIVANMPRWQPAKSREDGITPVKSKGALSIPFELY